MVCESPIGMHSRQYTEVRGNALPKVNARPSSIQRPKQAMRDLSN